jgi:predicted O-methyltransferase YrrM
MISDYRFDRSNGYPPHHFDWKRIDSNLINRDRFLEVGVAEGRSIITTAETLFNSNTEMYCVDSWSDPKEGEHNFDYNLQILREKYLNTFVKVKQSSQDAFIHFLSNNIKFDFIYIDSAKVGKSVIQDFALSFISLNKGGILMFDDYYLDREQHPLQDSKMALNMVMYQYQKHIHVIHKGKRCIIQKVKE